MTLSGTRFKGLLFYIIMGRKLYSSEVTAILKLRAKKIDRVKKNKEAFDKSYFGQLLIQQKQNEQRK